LKAERKHHISRVKKVVDISQNTPKLALEGPLQKPQTLVTTIPKTFTEELDTSQQSTTGAVYF
jgi:hypothetical protein